MQYDHGNKIYTIPDINDLPSYIKKTGYHETPRNAWSRKTKNEKSSKLGLNS